MVRAVRSLLPFSVQLPSVSQGLSPPNPLSSCAVDPQHAKAKQFPVCARSNASSLRRRPPQRLSFICGHTAIFWTPNTPSNSIITLGGPPELFLPSDHCTPCVREPSNCTVAVSSTGSAIAPLLEHCLTQLSVERLVPPRIGGHLYACRM